MIVRRTAKGLELVTQPDHAALAAEILSLWRDGGLPAHPRRNWLLLAAREHDNGWREADAAPRLDPESGEPLDFRHFPRRERFDLWQRTLDRLISTPWVLALVAQHALEIHGDRPAATWGDWRRSVEARRDDALARAEADPACLDADYDFLRLADTVSLVVCGAFDAATCRGYALRRRGEAVEIDPFPLAGATTFALPVRRVARGPYADPVELAGQLAAARWTRRPVRLTPAGPVIP